jgi:hypothetical protein
MYASAPTAGSREQQGVRQQPDGEQQPDEDSFKMMGGTDHEQQGVRRWEEKMIRRGT